MPECIRRLIRENMGAMRTPSSPARPMAALAGATALAASLLLGGCAMMVGTAVVTGTAAGANDRRPVNAIANDAVIESGVRGALEAAGLTGDGYRLEVTSYNRLVLLTGQAPGEADRKKALEAAGRIDLVRRVYDELTVGPPLSETEMLADFGLKLRVKANLLASTAPGRTHVKVVIENRTAFLMGLLTREEVEAVTEVVRATPGVGRIVRLFEEPPR